MKKRLLVLLLVLAAAEARAQIYHLTDLGAPAGRQIVTPYAINNSTQVAGTTELTGFRNTNGTMEELGPLPGGAVSAAFAINQLGQVAGESQFENGGSIRHAALWSNGTIIDIGTLPDYGNYGTARGINSATQVVGYASPSLTSNLTRAFIWEPGTGIRDLQLAVGSKALSINNAGTITGSTPYATGLRDAFVLDAAGNLQHLGTLGGVTSVGNFINEAGHIAGTSGINVNENRSHAFFYDGTTMHDLGTLGPSDFASDRSFGYGINNHDEIVGYSYLHTASGGVYQVAFVYRDGQMQNLETLVDGSGADYRLFSANAINDAGEIVVDAIKISTQKRRAVLLRPIRAVSRMSHAGSGVIDLNLPLSASNGAIESRAGNYQIVITFPGVVSVGNAALTSGSGTLSGVTVSQNTITVGLTNVATAQRLTLSLSEINDGQTSSSLVVPFAVLVGDANGDGVVNAADALLVRSVSGAQVNATNFRSDVNADGSLNAADALISRSNSGATLP